MTDLTTAMTDLGRRARAAASALRQAPADARTRALTLLSEKLGAALNGDAVHDVLEAPGSNAGGSPL